MSLRGYTRDVIVERATDLASQVGLTGLTLGALAIRLRRPKSTLFSHFNSKIQLQMEVLDNAAREFIREVVRPACKASGALPRIRRLFTGWMAWDRTGVYPGGCFFVATATEFDDQPGIVRDRLLRFHLAWQHLLRNFIASAVAAGNFRDDTDPDQFLQDLHGIMLAYHHTTRLIKDPGGERRALHAFEALLTGVRSGPE